MKLSRYILCLLLALPLCFSAAVIPFVKRTATAGDPSAASLTNFVAYWKLDEASGTRNDQSANVQHLTDNNTVTSAAGKVGNAAVFVTANSEYLSRADSTTLSTGNITFSFALWVRLTNKTALQSYIQKWSGVQQEYILAYSLIADRLVFGVSNTGSNYNGVNADTLGSPSSGVWYFIYSCHNADTDLLKISVNNGAVDAAAFTLGVIDSSAEFRIGGGEGGIPFASEDVDEVGFWKRDLTTAELTYLYNSGAGRTYNSATGLFE